MSRVALVPSECNNAIVVWVFLCLASKGGEISKGILGKLVHLSGYFSFQHHIGVGQHQKNCAKFSNPRGTFLAASCTFFVPSISSFWWEIRIWVFCFQTSQRGWSTAKNHAKSSKAKEFFEAPLEEASYKMLRKTEPLYLQIFRSSLEISDEVLEIVC